MDKIIAYLTNNKSQNIFLLIVYFLVVVLPHEKVGLIINAFFSRYSREKYNQIILIGSICLLGLILIFLIRRILASKERKKLLFFWALTIGFMAVVNTNLFVVNIESIHYVQYALFSFLIFPLFSNYYATLFWATIAGVLDEAYQYFILAPERTDYYDINDIITNFLGVCCGLLILKSLSIKEQNPLAKFERKVILPGLIFMSLLLFGLLLSPILSVFPSEESFQLVRKMPPGFWSEIPKVAVYHVVLPLEGAFIMIGLFVLYYLGFHDFRQSAA